MDRKGKIAGKWDPLYQVWRQAKGRCRNPNKPDYHRYGGRGVTFSPLWDDFEQFAADVGPHPGNGMTLDRADNDKGYEPGNVRWVTRKTQARNRSGYVLPQEIVNEIRAEYANGGVRQVDLAVKWGIHQVTVSKITRGETWS